ncbi:MAG: nuclear transport factor 2 family protein [candidate division Zixibacteria bacterium]|nr:nuclear transport factor 2 family protein [candidate division Zixibacteria bacterium]
MNTNDELAAIEKVCASMLRAWYGGNPVEMESVLHDDLAKRGVVEHPRTKKSVISHSGKKEMVEATRSGIGKIPEGEWAIETTILDYSETMATVRVRSAYLIDICQVAKIGDEWKIVNVLWKPWRTPPWFPS